MRAVILDNNLDDAARLKEILSESFPEIKPQAVIQTLEEGCLYFRHAEPPDIIFSELQFATGNISSVLSQLDIQVPVIFTCKNKDLVKQAFLNNGIDYIVKPVNTHKLQKGIVKLRSFSEHFTKKSSTENTTPVLQKKRLVVKKGHSYRSLRCEDIVLFYSAKKVVFLLDKGMDKYMTEKNLNFLETELDKKIFFRANRQYIINLNFIKSFKSVEKVRINVEMALPEGCDNRNIIISQQTAVKFREWIHSF